jgi:uncharacterized membrane protein YraQ (UPF0718 family)
MLARKQHYCIKRELVPEEAEAVELVYEILWGCWYMTVGMAPYLLLGFAAAAAISAFVTPATVEKHLGGSGVWPVAKAALFGVPLPLCSCGVIPVAASLRKHGAGKGATLSFILSTPQTGVDSIAVTYSLLGPVFAVFRPLVALVTGLVGGLAADRLDPDTAGNRCENGTGERTCCCGGGMRRKIGGAMWHGFVVLPADIALPMGIGIVVAGILGALVPDDFFASYLSNRLVQMLAMLAVSIPLYVCATASVPIAAAMILKGLSPGAALVFLIAGPATNAAGVAAVWKMLGTRSVVVYLATVGLTALLSGLALDAVMGSLAVTGNDIPLHHCDKCPSTLGTVSAVVLLTLLIAATLVMRLRKGDASERGCN